jgi:hypothetical protein
MLPLPDNCGLLPTPKETYDLNVSADTMRISSFRISTSIFCTKELYNPGLLPSPHSRPTFSKGIAFDFFYDNTRLPGSLLAAQGGRQSKDFRVL